MADFRALKNKARADLHERMKVRAYYFETDADVPIPCHVRVHTKNKALGDLKGTSLSYAETEAEVPKLIIWRDEIANPARGSVITIAADEGYKVDHQEPADGLTITVHVSRMTARDMQGRSFPDPT